MERIGDILKKRRLEIDISLEQAAEETMIASRYLESIERSDFSPFPGNVYAKGFLRRYADYLKLGEIETQRLLALYEAEQKKEEAAQPQIEKKGIDAETTVLRNVRANRKNLYLYSILAVLGFLIAGGILGAIIVPFLEKEPKIFIDPNKLLSHEELIRKDRVPEEKQGTITRSVVKPVIKGVLLEGNAFEEVWVQVQIDSGKNKEILVKAGEKIKWNAKEKICLTMGNAGAVAWKFNSKAIGTLGKTGIAKTMLFTPEKMQTVIKKEQPAPIPSKDEEKEEKTGIQSPGSLLSQGQGTTTQTAKEKVKEAKEAKETGTVSKPAPLQKIKKNEGNNTGTDSKQSTSLDKIQKGTHTNM